LDSKKEVLNALPSLFEEFVDISNLKFFTKKLENNKYLCFGYDESKITQAIKDSNLLQKQIKNIYFLQIELEDTLKTHEQTCMKVDGIYLTYIDNILVQIPPILKLDSDNVLNVDKIKLSKNILHLNFYTQYIAI